MPVVAKAKTCFVVGPIGSADSDDRVHADWLLEEIITPVFLADYAEFRIERADKLTTPGSINDQVITALLTSDLVIADISTLNANAFYEIGIRHMVQKPIIHMHLAGQRIPFDIAQFRSIEFSRARPKDLREARLALKSFIGTVLSADYQVENPVTYSRGKVQFSQSATAPEKLIQEQLSAIQARLSGLEREKRVFPDPRLDLHNIGYFGGGLERGTERITIQIGVNSAAHKQRLDDYMTHSFPTYLLERDVIEDNETNYVVSVPSKDGILKRLIALEENFIRTVPDGHFTII